MALTTTPTEVAAATRAMLRLADLWQLAPAESELLIGSDADIAEWEADPSAVPDDVQRRWGRLLTLHRLQKALLPSGDQAPWVRGGSVGGEMVIELLLNDPERLQAALETELASCVVAEPPKR